MVRALKFIYQYQDFITLPNTPLLSYQKNLIRNSYCDPLTFDEEGLKQFNRKDIIYTINYFEGVVPDALMPYHVSESWSMLYLLHE